MRINENEYSLCCEDGRSIWLRLPQGVAPDGVGLSVNGRVQTPTLDGEYVRVPGACDTSIWATVTLKAESQYRTQAILGHRYTICIRGEETVAIHPRGGIAPLF